ncbi:hypothetical protein Ddye_019818 [Dipteronia dyeriana]|uniref:J domain-containing protein n=1 Tax=Dipteronia dyeriana TaxID=168575 RepID=A0AAD9TZ38_9ROSI|nr:hypothetical protein Ddye_019818 [Dipteronia dyeriana]
MDVKKTNKNYYAILGIQDHRALIDTIKKNYKERVLMLHPDKCSSIAAVPSSSMKPGRLFQIQQKGRPTILQRVAADLGLGLAG